MEPKQSASASSGESETRRYDRSLDPLIEDPRLLPSLPPEVVGKARFNWQKELSEDGQKLYRCLLEERGDRDLLPIYAARERFDLPGAQTELRRHGLLDERGPEIVKLVRHRL